MPEQLDTIAMRFHFYIDRNIPVTEVLLTVLFHYRCSMVLLCSQILHGICQPGFYGFIAYRCPGNENRSNKRQQKKLNSQVNFKCEAVQPMMHEVKRNRCCNEKRDTD